MSYLEYVRGPVEVRGVDWVVIDVGGLGLRIGVLPGLPETLPTSGEAQLWTHLYVREDIRALYGFRSPEERAVFLQLLGVSGVGPAVAMALLVLGVDRLAATIEAGDEATLSKVPRVGKKTASRIILDLKGKLRGAGDASVAAGDGDVIEALTTWGGLSRTEAVAALNAVPPDPTRTIEETIRLALSYGARTKS